MIGAPTGPCTPRALSPRSPRYGSISSPPEAPSPTTRVWNDLTATHTPVDCTWRREARLCVHADTNNNVVVYPNYVFDPDGEIVPAVQPNTFELTKLVAKEAESINFAGQATGIMICTGAKGTRTRLGTFFQVSPTRAVGSFRATTVHNDPQRRLLDIWISKVCFIQHWETLFQNPRCRAKYFRRARIVPGFEEERERLLASVSDRQAVYGLTPPVPADFVILELPPDFHNDPYLKPLPRNKFKTIKKIGVVAYNQKVARNEERRADVYYATQGVPPFDAEGRVMHFGTKSLSPGIMVGFTDSYISFEASLLDGAVGGPLVSLTRPHYFWGMHACAFSDVETYQANKSRNYNVALSFYHPVFSAMFAMFVLDTLPEQEAYAIRQECF